MNNYDLIRSQRRRRNTGKAILGIVGLGLTYIFLSNIVPNIYEHFYKDGLERIAEYGNLKNIK